MSKTTGSKSSDSFGLRYALSCAAATVAETVTYPLDIVKTRLQIHGESHSVKIPKNTAQTVVGTQRQTGMFRVAANIVREEGILKLWQGVSPAVVRHYVYTGVRIVVYESLREKIFTHKAKDGTFPLWEAICSGMLSGAIAQFLASPTDLVKIQMQTEGRRRLEGLPPRTTSMYQAFSRVYSEGGGIKGLWKGWVPNCQRAALVNMADLATYDKVKHTLLKKTSLKDNYVTHALSSAFAGFAAAVASTPADVVKTRIMNQPTDIRGVGLLYKSSTDCLMKTVRNEGFFALYKGFIPIWTRMAPWSLTFWVSYEHIRQITGVSSF